MEKGGFNLDRLVGKEPFKNWHLNRDQNDSTELALCSSEGRMF